MLDDRSTLFARMAPQRIAITGAIDTFVTIGIALFCDYVAVVSAFGTFGTNGIGSVRNTIGFFTSIGTFGTFSRRIWK